jgi:alpha-tubulin suppressor-like RCC1 family protein
MNSSSIITAFFAACWLLGCSGLSTMADVFPYGLGANGLGQVGDAALSDRSSPVAVASGDRPVASGARASTDRWLTVSAGGGHSVALGSDGKVYGWGANASGQLGDETTSDRSRAVVVEAGEIPVGVSLQQVSAGGSHSLGLGSDGKVYAWGANGYGQLGDGTLIDRARVRWWLAWARFPRE